VSLITSLSYSHYFPHHGCCVRRSSTQCLCNSVLVASLDEWVRFDKGKLAGEANKETCF
jgi:hypothetical protein